MTTSIFPSLYFKYHTFLIHATTLISNQAPNALITQFPPHDNYKNMQTWNVREETANHMGIWMELPCTILLISLLPCMTCMQCTVNTLQ